MALSAWRIAFQRGPLALCALRYALCARRYSIIPSIVVEADAYDFFGMRPAS